MKRIISWALRNIPRRHLQKFAHFIARFLGLFYKGNKVQCPVCNSKYRKFLPYGRGKSSRPNALCPKCLSLERHRLMYLFLKQKTDYFKSELKVLHVAPEICFIKRFDRLENLDYITGDLESPLAKVKMDVHQIPFDDNTFDVAFCNHVLEHVEDDIAVLNEFHRVLKPGGWGIFQSPMDYSLETTYEDPTITDPREREKHFKQDDHLRIYGRDYDKRLGQSKFQVEVIDLQKELQPDQVTRYSLPDKEMIYLCRKEA